MMPPDAPELDWVEQGPEGPSREELRRRRHRRSVLLAFFLAVALLLGALGGYALWAMRGTSGGDPVRVLIPKGANAGEISDLLAEHGVIRAPLLFRVVVRWRGVGDEFKPGEYVFRKGLGYAAVIDLLKTGPPIEVSRVTVPEGKTVAETARIFEREAGIPASEFLAAVEGGRRGVPILPRGVRSLEGFLFPKTYDVKEEATAEDVVELLLGQFRKEARTLDFSRARTVGVTAYEAVVIASMIEREAKVPGDRAKISAVIYNRLRRGMRLEIDATVQYAIFQRTGSYKSPLTFADLEIRSPYNTYLIDRLPPTPIASPGLASLQAALAPADVDYLYYVVINEKGEHAFASNFRDFQRLRRQAQS